MHILIKFAGVSVGILNAVRVLLRCEQKGHHSQPLISFRQQCHRTAFKNASGLGGKSC
jgi:hypothetical protein